MEEVEKIKAILEKSHLSQNELALKIGVSGKSLRNWLSGNSVPRDKNINVINQLHKEYFTTDNAKPVKTTLKDMFLDENLNAMQSGETEEAKKRKDIYYNGKKIVLTLEKQNKNRLFLFPSAAKNKGEWYKMGGNSALFYMYYIAPRVKKKPKLRQDMDVHCRFKDGVISVHWIDHFINNIEKIGLKVKKDAYDIVVVELEEAFSASEIKEMRERAGKEEARFRQMVMPKENFPDIYNSIRRLAQLLVPKVKHLDGAYREIFGNHFLKLVIDTYELYFHIANGIITKQEGYPKIIEKIDAMRGLIMLADEVEWFDFTTRTRVGETLVDLETTLEKRTNEANHHQ